MKERLALDISRSQERTIIGCNDLKGKLKSNTKIEGCMFQKRRYIMKQETQTISFVKICSNERYEQYESNLVHL